MASLASILRTATIAFGLLNGCAVAAEPLKLVMPPFEYVDRPETMYFRKLLELALRKTEADGAYVIGAFPEPMSPQRAIEEIKKRNGLINLMFNGSSPQRERELLAVRVSLLRDLNNYRLLLIRKGDQARFDSVRSLEDLKRFTAGMGMQWPDSDILRASGVPVMTSDRHSLMFRMLEAKRFDYTPRGLYEVWAEAELPENRQLAIENSIMLYYEVPFYFFVGKHDAALARRIERGLKMAQADGSFDRLMQSVPGFKRGMEEQRRTGRRLIVFPSPRAVQ